MHKKMTQNGQLKDSKRTLKGLKKDTKMTL